MDRLATVKPNTAQMFARWLHEASARDAESFGIKPTHPRLYAVK